MLWSISSHRRTFYDGRGCWNYCCSVYRRARYSIDYENFPYGGIAGLDITSGLPRVIELFEARIPKGVSILSEISGNVKLGNVGELRVVRISNTEKNSVTTQIPDTTEQL
ncbi:MAG: hypothetical protein Ct9H90mP2_09410 [Dehalococcoidia bacterium]|nr:MAG: hypothetical protein Ct9H90mP2_09410 [Dehalococcoidia bacterium]